MNFNETIKNALAAKNKTQIDLAEYVGVTQSTISLKIRLKRHLLVTEFHKICSYLNLDENELFRIYSEDLRQKATKRDLTK